MSRNDELRTAVADSLQAMGEFVESVSKLSWTPTDGMLPVICSAILRRQYECLSVAVDLVDKSQGFAAVALLRPACEEFLWTKYLTSLHSSDAEQLLVLMGRKELTDSLKAQDDYAGRAVSERLGLAQHIIQSELSSRSINSQIKALGVKLKWDKRTIEASKLPSVAFIAKSVGETRLYRFLYHASSRYVHFSPAELLRRAWGRTGNVTLSSACFADYWGSFVIYWGVYLLASTLPLVVELGVGLGAEQKLDADKLLAAAERIGKFGAVPIITSEELAWESAAS